MRTAHFTEIETRSGALVDLLCPDLDDVNLDDIAHSLALQCRYSGHCIAHYSVAQHSCLVADLLDDEDRIHGLLHDTPEYLIGDLATPVKEAMQWISPDFKRAWSFLDRVAERAVYNKLGVRLPTDAQRERVKRADMIAAAIEQRDVMRSPNVWRLPYPAGDETIAPVAADLARDMWLDAMAACGVTGERLPEAA